MDAALCFTAWVSLSQSSLGRRRLTASPVTAIKAAKAAGVSTSSVPIARLGRSTQTAVPAHTSRGGRQTAKWARSLARRISRGVTGRLLRIQRFFPSREMEEVVRSTVPQQKQMINMATAGNRSGFSAPISPAASNRSARFTTRAAAPTSISSAPMPALRR